MIKRTLLVLALIAVLVFIATPALIGVVVEQSEPDLLAALSRRIDDVVVEQRQFQRRWFDSTSQWRMVQVDSGERLDVEVRYRHGPWFGAPGWLDFEAALVPDASGLGGRASARVSPLVNLSGQFGFSWPGQVELDAAYHFHRAEKRLQLDLNRLHLAFSGLILGDGRGRVERVFERRGPGRLTLALQAGRLDLAGVDARAAELELDYRGDRQAVALAMRLAAARLTGYGEDWSALDAGARLEGLHYYTVYALMASARNRWQSGLRGTALLDQLQADALLALPALLRRQPRLALEEIAWWDADGDARLAGQLGFTAPPPAGFLADPSLLGQVLDVDLQAHAPQALLERWAPRLADDPAAPSPEAAGEALITGLRANRIIVPSADRYQLDLNYREQRLTLNGQPMMLPTF